MAERYMNRKNFRTAVIVHRNTVNDLISLKYDDGNGTATVSTVTLKKGWKKVDDSAPVQSENVASDGTPYTEVMQEIVQDEKQAAKKAEKKSKKSAEKKPAEKKQKAEKSDVKKAELIEQHFNTIKSVLDSTDNISYRLRERTPFLLVVMFGEETFFEARATKEGATFSCKVADVPDGLEYKEYKYYRPASIKTEANYLDVLSAILDKRLKEEN